jgi:hypothetical protein
MIPKKSQCDVIIDFSIREVLWQHCAIHAPSFRKECENFWSWGERKWHVVHYSWLALFWVTLAIGVRAMKDSELLEIGMKEGDNKELPKKYFEMVLIALHKSDFMLNHSIFSLQAIAIAVTCCHDIW